MLTYLLYKTYKFYFTKSKDKHASVWNRLVRYLSKLVKMEIFSVSGLGVDTEIERGP